MLSEKGLRNALKNGDFFLCYQPIFDIEGEKVVYLEALIRLNWPGKGIINPKDFIPIAEDTGLIIPIGEWVLREACKQLKKWHEMGYTGYSISVNVSAIQLQQPNFFEVVNRILSKSGVLPQYLELEITESALIESTNTVETNFVNFRRQGVRVSIDDFGTGYNSLENLQKIVVNSLKIDRTFILNINLNNVNKIIIDTIISLGHKINAKVIAEGIETREQYEYLKMKGCDMIQGYYFSKPLLPEEAIEFFKDKKEPFILVKGG